MSLGLLLLQLFASASSSRILTGTMIRRPRQEELTRLQRVPLLLPAPRPNLPTTVSPLATGRLGSTSSLEKVSLRRADILETTVLPLQETTTTSLEAEVYSERNITHVQANSSITGNTTRLYPVGRLWKEERSETGIWSLLHAAYLCLFSGLHCFSDRVYPMFKSYLSMAGHTQPLYPLLLPRTEQDTGSSEWEEEQESEVEESRGLLRSRLLKDLLLGLLLVKVSILPWLGGIGLASGKALLTGFLSLGAAGAVAALDSPPNYYM